MSQAQNRPGYVDSHYLQSIYQLTRQVKQRSHELMQVRPGQAVLDVGCGPGLDTVPLGGLVGSGGKVVGLDYDPEMIALADQKAEQAGVADRVSHQVAELPPIPFADHTFDSTHSERLFQHIADPGAFLAELVRVTRPGGWVVVADTDHTSLSIDLANPELSDIDWRLRRFQAGRYVNGSAGRQLYRLFRASGLGEISLDLFPLFVTEYSLGRFFTRMTEYEAKALAAGVVEAAELVHLHAAYEQAEQNGQFFGYIVMILAAGRKPLE